MSIEVTTQAELDAAVKAHPDELITITGDGWFTVRSGHFASGSAYVEAYGSASVRASGSASVRAYGSASVTAYGSASVEAYDSASVTASGSASVTASGSASVTASGSASVRAYGSASVRASGSASVEASGSASVEAYDSAYVEAYDSAYVRAYGSAYVEAYDSAYVRAYDSASVRAYGSAYVEAYGSASVEAYDSAYVRASGSAYVTASRMVAVHNHNPDNKYGTVKITGGVIIDVRPAANLDDWFADNLLEPVAGVVTLYKAVDDAFKSGYGFAYTPGSVPVAPDWDGGVAECGGGLHFCAAPWIAKSQFNLAATRFVACPINVTDIAFHPGGQLPSKVKAKGCCAPVWECDIDGKPVQP